MFDNGRKQRDRMVAVDLGSRTTKAVSVQRRGDRFILNHFAMLDAPIFEKAISADLLGEHLKAVNQALDGGKSRLLTITVGVNDSLLRHAELPRMPVDDMRMVLKLNSKTYLQQELTNYLYDCHILPATAGKDGKALPGQPKHKVLIAAAKKQVVDELVNGAKAAGFVADHVVPSLVGPANVFERSVPEVFKNEIVAIVDVGFKSSSICILEKGELALSRVVAIGGDKLTSGLAESMNISYAEAEGIKVGMPGEVQDHLDRLVTPLGRELRASIDFYEHQADKAVSQAFITGGSSRSEMIVERLQNELMIECKPLNPVNFMQMELPAQQTAEIEAVAPQLTVALGAALASL